VSRWLRRAGGGAGWLLAGAAVAAHATLGVLAVAEYAWLGWLADTRYDLAAVTLVLASAVAGLAAAARVALRAAAGYWGCAAWPGTTAGPCRWRCGPRWRRSGCPARSRRSPPPSRSRSLWAWCGRGSWSATS
jgi:hypothetical protein